jgi:ferrous iron transport protein B
MSVGQTGIISHIKGDDVVASRIREMGLGPGVVIEIVGRAPLNDPVHIKLRGNSLTLRNNEADHILVDTEAQGADKEDAALRPGDGGSNEQALSGLKLGQTPAALAGICAMSNRDKNRPLVVALAGNPNAGKSSLFNKLTGLHAHVGNWPGVTVEQKWGEFTHKGRTIKLVDLPGIYSLTPYSLDEQVARDFILNEKPDLVVDVIDSTNLERNLYLAMGFLELGIPTVLAMNMMDLAQAAGLNIDLEKIEKILGVSAVPVVARTGLGLEALLDRMLEAADRADGIWRPLEISYGQDTDEALDVTLDGLKAADPPLLKYPHRWLAIKLMEGDPLAEDYLGREASALLKALIPARDRLAAHFKTTTDNDIAAELTEHRYGFLAGLRRAVVPRPPTDLRRLSDAIDKVILNRLLAPVFFLAAIYCLYQFTFWASGPMVAALESFFGFLGGAVEAGLADGLLKDLVLEGLIGGIGAVLGFVPLIAFMFIGISILEDSGYMARAAFILDRIFRAFGLHGNSAMALIVGGGIAGGCAIPGVMATRTLRDLKERIATIIVTPMMNCGAKLPVFLMLTGAFFAERQALIMLSLTIFAWIVALVSAKLIRTIILPGEPAPFILELPPYRLPTVSGVLLHAWERTWGYIKRAGTIIVVVTVAIWLMMTFPSLPAEREAEYAARAEVAASEEDRAKTEAEAKAESLRNSLAGRLGLALEPVSSLVGFEWRTNIALVGGFAAKEVILSTLGTTYAMEGAPGPAKDLPEAEADQPEETEALEESDEVDEIDFLVENLAQALAQNPAWSPLAAVSLMVFVLLYAPCFPTIIIIRKEIGARWAAFAVGANTLLAFLLSLVVYQGGLALGF